MQGYAHTLSSGLIMRGGNVTATVAKGDRGYTLTQLRGLTMQVNTGEYAFKSACR